jgi:hypothetical protein
MTHSPRDLLDLAWSKLGECTHCRHRAFLGVLLGVPLLGLIVTFGDVRQLAMAGGLAAASLAVLWGVHRIAYATRMALAQRTAVAAPINRAAAPVLH